MFHWFGVVQNTRGDALSGWQVGLVEVGTQTVVPIFADENSTPIVTVSGVTNRAISDENGNYDFYVPSGTYTIQFFNAAGVFQRSQRFVAMYGADFATDSANMDFTQSGTGAVTRDVQAKLRETVSVKDFGAVGNGVTNDAAAIQAAVDYAETFAEGAEVHFPAGKYLVNSTVTVLKSGVSLIGDGAPATWIVNGTTNAPAVRFGDGVTTYFRNRIENLIFGQASGVTPVAGNCGLKIHKCGQFQISGVQAFNFPAALRVGIELETATQGTISTVGVQGCTSDGIYMHNQTLDIYADKVRVDACANGFHFRDCQGIYGANMSAYGNSVNAFRFTTTGSADNNQFFFLTNCIGDTSGSHNWYFEQCSLSVFTACWAATQLVPVTGPAADGFHLAGSDVEDLEFVGCVAVTNNRHGMNVLLGNNVTINGGTFGSNFKSSSFGGLGQRNGLAGTGSGIRIAAGSDRIAIRGAKCRHNKDWGIDIDAGATKVEVSDCELRFNIDGGSLRNNANGTAAEVTIKNCPGYNPIGFITAPTVPASNTPITNLTGVDVMVYLVGGTLTGNVQINGHGVLQATNTGYFLPAGGTIRLTYSSAPAWSWNGL